MSSAQKKINLNNLLTSESKNSINEKMKNRNYKTFIKRIKANSTEKFEFSVNKNQQNSTFYQNQNLLNNLTNLNNYNTNNINNTLLTNQIQNKNFHSNNYSSKEKINDRYSINNFQNNTANLLEKKINEKRAKSGLATSLSNLEILRKQQDSRTTNVQDTTTKIPISNESNPSTSSNKIDIKISFNYSKNNSLNNKSNNGVSNNNISNNTNFLANNTNSNLSNITNNFITNNNYANYYLRYKNLSKANNNSNLNNCTYSNVDTSNNIECMNTYSNLNNSIHNKNSILNSSYFNNKPTILQDQNIKNKLINVNHSTNFNLNGLNKTNLQNEKLSIKKKIANINNYETEITSEDMKKLNNSVSKKLNNLNKSTNYNKKQQSESHFYQNNLKISLNNNENKQVITNYYSKNKGSNNSFAFNENLMDKLNRGINSINVNKNDLYKNQVLSKYKLFFSIYFCFYIFIFESLLKNYFINKKKFLYIKLIYCFFEHF